MTRFSVLIRKINFLSRKLDIESQVQLKHTLAIVRKRHVTINTSLISYCHSLLFICAHPFDKQLLALAEKELGRISQTLKKANAKKLLLIQNSGLPFTSSVFSFSQDCLVWIQDQSLGKLELINISNDSLNKVLEHTLPSLERSNTTAGFSHEELFDVLLVRKSQRVSFLVNQFYSLNQQPTIKDYLFDTLALETKFTPANKNYSIAYNRIYESKIYFQREWNKKIDIKNFIEKNIPAPSELLQKNKSTLINCIKMTMALNIRETDPATYLDEASLRLYQLEHGISIAIYGMVANRQLPLESYMGYTLFKNGFPVAYGGSWIYGKTANFGINILEPFRGGESSYLLGQLLRVYRNIFKVTYFEIEPYQFGLDNPDGIESSAFWFYYRNAFRPVDRNIKTLADATYKQLTSTRSRKVSKATLKKFTDSNLALNLGSHIPPSLPSLINQVTKMIKREFDGDRQKAVTKCIESFYSKSNVNFLDTTTCAALEEMALVAKALNVTKRNSIENIVSMIEVKSRDQYTYQLLLSAFLEKVKY
ncbi:MAG TPA: hypothetical protein VIS49_13085 [Cyclobacteriaceae bacterium]